MTTGSFTRTAYSQVWDRYTNDGGTYGWFNVGPKYTKSWSGGDNTQSLYTKVRMAVPSWSPPIKRTRKDGSTYYVEPKQFTKYVTKRVKTAKYRPPNAFSSDNRRWRFSIIRTWSGTPPYVNAAIWQLVQLPVVPSMSGSEIFTNNDSIQLVNKLAERVQDVDFQPAIAVAEIDKTCRMIADRAKNLARSLAYLRKGDFAKALKVVAGYRQPRKGPRPTSLAEYKFNQAASARANYRAGAEALAARVLEVQYGWRPLISDMHDGAVWLAALQSKPNTLRLQVRKRRIVENGSSGAGVWFGSRPTEVRKQIIAYLSESSFAPTLNAWNVAEIAWERVPFSFLVDWAIPIQSYLSARGTARSLVGTFVTTVSTRKRLYQPVVKSPDGSWQYTQCRQFTVEQGAPAWSEEFITRTVSNSLNVDLPSFKGLRQIASWEHALNAVSLLVVAGKAKPDDVLRQAGRL